MVIFWATASYNTYRCCCLEKHLYECFTVKKFYPIMDPVHPKINSKLQLLKYMSGFPQAKRPFQIRGQTFFWAPICFDSWGVSLKSHQKRAEIFYTLFEKFDPLWVFLFFTFIFPNFLCISAICHGRYDPTFFQIGGQNFFHEGGGTVWNLKWRGAPSDHIGGRHCT